MQVAAVAIVRFSIAVTLFAVTVGCVATTVASPDASRNCSNKFSESARITVSDGSVTFVLGFGNDGAAQLLEKRDVQVSDFGNGRANVADGQTPKRPSDFGITAVEARGLWISRPTAATFGTDSRQAFAVANGQTRPGMNERAGVLIVDAVDKRVLQIVFVRPNVFSFAFSEDNKKLLVVSRTNPISPPSWLTKPDRIGAHGVDVFDVIATFVDLENASTCETAILRNVKWAGGFVEWGAS